MAWWCATYNVEFVAAIAESTWSTEESSIYCCSAEGCGLIQCGNFVGECSLFWNYLVQPSVYLLWERRSSTSIFSTAPLGRSSEKIRVGECSLYSNCLVQPSVYLLWERRSSTSIFSTVPLGRSSVKIRVGECSLYSNYLVQSSFLFGVQTEFPHLLFRTTTLVKTWQQPYCSVRSFSASITLTNSLLSWEAFCVNVSMLLCLF